MSVITYITYRIPDLLWILGSTIFFRNARWCQPWVLGLTNTSEMKRGSDTSIHPLIKTQKVHPTLFHAFIPSSHDISYPRHAMAGRFFTFFRWSRPQEDPHPTIRLTCWREHPQGMIESIHQTLHSLVGSGPLKTITIPTKLVGCVFFFQLQEIWWRTIFWNLAVLPCFLNGL